MKEKTPDFSPSFKLEKIKNTFNGFNVFVENNRSSFLRKRQNYSTNTTDPFEQRDFSFEKKEIFLKKKSKMNNKKNVFFLINQDNKTNFGNIEYKGKINQSKKKYNSPKNKSSRKNHTQKFNINDQGL